MEVAIEALAATPLAEWMRTARWSYAIVNIAHVLGFALLVGAISTFNVRLLGAWRHTPVNALAPILIPVAVTGLGVALITGALLFLAKPTYYAGLWLFGLKIGLIVAGLAHALIVQIKFNVATISVSRQRLVGAFSLLIWIGVLVTGRMVGYMEN